ncbi:hypothetical protein ACFL6S_32295 [Candidatus Poribacteria bacterium]
MSKWISVTGACQALDMSERTVRRHIKEGKLESKLDEKGRRLVLVEEDEDQADDRQTAEVDELRAEVARLKAEVDGKQDLIDEFRKQLDALRQALQQAQVNLDHNQQLLAYAQMPWWRKLGRKALMPPPDQADDT